MAGEYINSKAGKERKEKNKKAVEEQRKER